EIEEVIRFQEKVGLDVLVHGEPERNDMVEYFGDPQTAEIRALRRDWKAGALTDSAYEAAIRKEIEEVIRFQEKVGLDVLVHGEPERNDMVEYFG
ncbi:hypothetical protein CTI14_62525, partial [Methylobacterium radiotolerans]